ncbi:unnamed protein product [Auanema sp. JU1783]|nr:unnamed protein product [Auanema sp. JU1783]
MLKLVAFAVLALSANQILAEKLNCEGKVGTFLVKGCNKFYTMCSSNGAFLYECPSGLKFDYRRRLCDYTENIPECKHERKYRNHVFEALPLLKCDDREPNVNFVHPKFPCDNYYYSCSPGAQEPVRQTCPYNQFFDESLNLCDFVERVKACKKSLVSEGKKKQQKRNQKISGYAELDDSSIDSTHDKPVADIGSPAPPPSPSKLPAMEITSGNAPGAPNCLKVDTGVYRDSEEKCSEQFWKCSNKKLFRYKCQDGLFYDAETKRCDHKSFIPDCGGVREVTTPLPAADPVVVEFDCAKKEDNFYVKEPCTNVFYHCNGGLARKLDCQPGLVYDTRINACDYPEACKNERPVAAAPSLYDHGSVKEQPKKEEKITFDCSSLEDGLYEEKKCTQKYIQCVSGQPHRMSCVQGLVYNKESGNCDYLENCLTPSTATAAPVIDQGLDSTNSYAPPPPHNANPIKKISPTTTESSYITSTTTTTTTTTKAPEPYAIQKQSAAVQKPTLVGISCTNLADGPTALELCSADYVECWQGVGTSQKCPGDLIFNTYTGQCDYLDNVPGCGSKKLPAESPIEITTTTTQRPVEEIDEFCKTLTNGFHGDGCKSIFYHCSSGETHKMQCPSDLFYDNEEKLCDHKENVVACGAKPKTTTTAPEPKTSVYGYPDAAASQPEQTTTTASAPQPTQPPRSIFNCAGKKDGLYALPTCTDIFIQCHNENTHERECQSGLFYNDVNGMCDYKENIPSCGGSVSTAAPMTAAPIAESQPVVAAPGYSASAPNAYDSPVGATPPAKVKPTRPAPALSCNGKADGYYSAGCSPEYFSCINGAMEKLGCPPVLRFSEATGRCDFTEFVSECGGSPATPAPVPTTSSTPVELAAAQQQGPYQPITKPAPVPTADSCVGKTDGQYSQGCSQNYFTCLNGAALKVSCPETLRFSQTQSKCDYPQYVEECGGKAPVQQTVPVTQAPLSTSRPIRTKPQKPSFTCMNKADGFYSNGCESTYASCLNGRTGILKCPGSLKFSSTEGRCDFEERVPECGGTPPTASPAAAEPVAPVASIHSCVGKIDGYYAVGCSEEYFSCNSGMATTMNCPAHLRFDQESSFCDYPLAVTECGGSRQTSAQAPIQAPAKQSLAPAVPDFDCSQKSDGYYAVAPCSPFYASCESGLKKVGLCPSQLKYNSLNGKCEFDHSVLACTVAPPAPVAPAAPIAPVAPVVPAPAQAQQPEFSCVGRPLGNYALAECSQEFAQCTPYSVMKRKCAFGLVYNSATGSCDTPTNVKGCAKLAASLNVSAPQLQFTCAGRVDGQYAASRCASSYFRCDQEKSTQYSCGTGLVFDQSQGICNYPSYVQGC